MTISWKERAATLLAVVQTTIHLDKNFNLAGTWLASLLCKPCDSGRRGDVSGYDLLPEAA
jgi:hypothetical protein